jgi:hypothetical protein
MIWQREGYWPTDLILLFLDSKRKDPQPGIVKGERPTPETIPLSPMRATLSKFIEIY